MKTLFLTSILCVLSWASSLAQPVPLTQAVHSLTAPAPSVTTTPMALTATDPATLRAFVQAADTLRARAETRINALKAEIKTLDEALASNQKLSRHDYERSQQLATELTLATDSLRRTDGMLDQVRQALPRRFRKRAADSVAALYDCLVEYEADLKRRGNRLFLFGVTVGTVGGFLLKAKLL